MASGKPIPEDLRIADWRFYLPLDDNANSLTIGCGWGTLPVALCETCKTVYAVDKSADRIDFLNVRKEQQIIENLYPLCVGDYLSLPFSNGSFDLISIADHKFDSKLGDPFCDIVHYAYDLLKDGGCVNVFASNKFSIRGLLDKDVRKEKKLTHTLYGYKNILKKMGFSNIKVYSPLPRYEGISLVNLPIEDARIRKFFFRDILPIFEMVSPESKKAYVLESLVAKIGVPVVNILGLDVLAKFFTPGFNIIAKKVL